VAGWSPPCEFPSGVPFPLLAADLQECRCELRARPYFRLRSVHGSIVVSVRSSACLRSALAGLGVGLVGWLGGVAKGFSRTPLAGDRAFEVRVQVARELVESGQLDGVLASSSVSVVEPGMVQIARDADVARVSERPEELSTGSDRVEEQSIPRVIHCIWLGSKTIPEIFWPCVESWVRHHPDWKLQLWRDDTLPPLSCQAEFERAMNFKVKYDIVRLELLRQLGGVVIDMDMEAIRPIDPLLEDVVAFVGHKGPYRKRIGTQVLGAVPHHPFFEQVVERLREAVGTPTNASHQAGPAFLGQVVAEYGGGDLTIFPYEIFYSPLTIEPPIRPDAFPEIYAVHHHFGSYDDAPDARVSNLQRRLRDAEREIQRERKRSRQLAKRLSRLEQRSEGKELRRREGS
jgi:Glycosyltransferase sugar-binding region containing DXD motif